MTCARRTSSRLRGHSERSRRRGRRAGCSAGAASARRRRGCRGSRESRWCRRTQGPPTTSTSPGDQTENNSRIALFDVIRASWFGSATARIAAFVRECRVDVVRALVDEPRAPGRSDVSTTPCPSIEGPGLRSSSVRLRPAAVRNGQAETPRRSRARRRCSADRRTRTSTARQLRVRDRQRRAGRILAVAVVVRLIRPVERKHGQRELAVEQLVLRDVLEQEGRHRRPATKRARGIGRERDLAVAALRARAALDDRELPFRERRLGRLEQGTARARAGRRTGCRSRSARGGTARAHDARAASPSRPRARPTRRCDGRRRRAQRSVLDRLAPLGPGSRRARRLSGGA
jgi:hypothetical protein